MTETQTTALSDSQLAAHLATLAGDALLALRGGGLTGQDLRDAGDRTAHGILVEQLAHARPWDAVLSEEAADDPARLTADRVWIVDPLDGTREYSEPERSDWAVHVALWERGILIAGAVARPALGIVHSTDSPLAEEPGTHDRIRLAVSRTRPPGFVTTLAASLDAELVPLGSAGVKAMSVVTGESDAYVHAGGQFEWDSAAPVAVAAAAGLHTSRLDGTPLEYNQPNPYLPDLIICRPDVLDRLRACLEQVATRSPTPIATGAESPLPQCPS